MDSRPLKVFLCHASADKPAVRDLYKRLVADGVDAWLDAESLIPGQNWQVEIPKAIRDSDVVLVCLSEKSINKEGYVQKEIKSALDVADEKPEGTIFIIPARLEECKTPDRLSLYHWVDLYEEDGYQKLMRALRLRAEKIGAVLQAKRSWLPNITIPRATSRKSAEIRKPESAKKKQAETPHEIPNNKIQQKSETPLPANNFPDGWEAEWQPAIEWEKSSTKQESTEKTESKPAITTKTPRKWNTLIVVATIIIGFPILITLFTNWTWKQWFVPRLVTITPTNTVAFTPAKLTLTKVYSTVTFTPVLPTKTEIPTLVLTATSQPTEFADEKGIEMVLVPEGDFIMGGRGSEKTIYLDVYYIDKYEATNSQYAQCVLSGKCITPSDTILATYNYYGNPQYDNFPVVWVNSDMVKAYCNWRGARLPTEAEWEKAARGTDGRIYPWGNTVDNVIRANTYGADDGYEITSPVGVFPEGVSPYGAYDMAGNVWEWTSELFTNTSAPYCRAGCTYPITKGSSWVWGDLSVFDNSSAGERGSRFDLGIRCARDANP